MNGGDGWRHPSPLFVFERPPLLIPFVGAEIAGGLVSDELDAFRRS
jgi:hypothetical protein